MGYIWSRTHTEEDKPNRTHGMRYNLSWIHEMGNMEWNTRDATYSRVTRNGNNRNTRSGTHRDGTHDVERIESGTHTEWDTNRTEWDIYEAVSTRSET